MDKKSDKVVISVGDNVLHKIDATRPSQSTNQQPLMKVLPKSSHTSSSSSISGGSAASIVTIAPQLSTASGSNVGRSGTTVIVPTSHSTMPKPLPTMLKRLPGNISVSTQSIIIQPSTTDHPIIGGPSNVNLIPNQPVIVQPINIGLGAAVVATNASNNDNQPSLLKHLTNRENKVIVEKIGERSTPISVVNSAKVVQVLNSGVAANNKPTKMNDSYIVNAMPNEMKPKSVLKLRPTDKVRIKIDQPQPSTRVMVTGQKIYKPIAPAPPKTPLAKIITQPGIITQPTGFKTIPSGIKLPIQPMISAVPSTSKTLEKKPDSKVDKILIVRNTTTGSTELVRVREKAVASQPIDNSANNQVKVLHQTILPAPKKQVITKVVELVKKPPEPSVEIIKTPRLTTSQPATLTASMPKEKDKLQELVNQIIGIEPAAEKVEKPKVTTSAASLSEYHLKEKQLIQSLKRDAGKIQVPVTLKKRRSDYGTVVNITNTANRESVLKTVQRKNDEPNKMEIVKQSPRKPIDVEHKINVSTIRRVIGLDPIPVPSTSTGLKSTNEEEKPKNETEETSNNKDVNRDKQTAIESAEAAKIQAQIAQLQREKTPDLDDLIEEEKFTPSTNSSENSAPQTPVKQFENEPASQSSGIPVQKLMKPIEKKPELQSTKIAPPPVSSKPRKLLQVVAKPIASTSTAGPSKDQATKDGHIQISIKDGKLSNPNGPIRLLNTVCPTTRSPRMQQRSKSALESPIQRPRVLMKKVRSPSFCETYRSIFNDVKITSMLPIDKKPTFKTTTADFIQLLCDENIDAASDLDKSLDKLPQFPSRRALIDRPPTKRKRKMAQKMLTAAGIEIDGKKVEGSGSKRSSPNSSPEPKLIKYSDEENGDDEDEGIADVMKIPVAKLFELSSDQSGDDIYIGDPFRCIHWDNGVGSLRNGSVHFKINEFGIYELMSNDEYYKCKETIVDKELQDPIGKRKTKRRHVLPKSGRYECFVCHGIGAADEMLQPNICSWYCKALWAPVKSETSSRDSDDDSQDSSWVKETEAPSSLFRNPFPTDRNQFQYGMKLEVIDPLNQYLFCVGTVIDKRGYRIKVRFDGYPSDYDIWVNADSNMIFPPGWCAATGRSIDPPPSYPSNKKFDWNYYLKDPKTMAPVQLFPHLKDKDKSAQFTIDSKLEVDLPETLDSNDAVTAGTIKDVIGNRVLIHFDFYDHKYDFWIDINSPLIHPINWHQQYNIKFKAESVKNVSNFDWKAYLLCSQARAVPDTAFNPREPVAFRPGMQVEVVDPKNPALLRPAMITNIEGYRVRILFDGWRPSYAFWMPDDSPDLHPVGWHKTVKHTLEHSKLLKSKTTDNCLVIPECRRLGNWLNKGRQTHKLPDECPYLLKNWNAEVKNDRLDFKRDTIRRRGRPSVNGGSAGASRSSRSGSTSSETASVVEIKGDHIVVIKDEDNVVEIEDEKEELIDLTRLTRHERLRQAADLMECHGNSLPELNERNVYDWTVEDVQEFIRKIRGLTPAIVETFVKQEIDGSALVCFSKDDLVNVLGMKYGPAIKIYNRILQLRQQVMQDLSIH